MNDYQLTSNPYKVIRLSDNAVIPDVTVNYGDALLYQAFIANGGIPDPADPLPVIVREIDARRLRRALSDIGVLTAVKSAIATLPESAQIDWEYATTIKEDYPLVQSLSSSLGLDIKVIFDKAETYT